MEFNGKVVLITGAAGEIGEVTAKLFSELGAKLSLIDLDRGGLRETVTRLGLGEGEYITVPADVSREDEVKNYVRKTVEAFGRIDVFFNNAGIEGKYALIKDNPAENLDRVLNVNLKGVFFGLKHVIPVMMERKSGSIINTSSVAGLGGFPGLSPYVASKHAVIGLTKTAALEYAGTGVRVNAICPAPINTRMMRSVEKGASPDDPQSAQSRFTHMIPMGRYGEPEEVANLVLFLASDLASYINGGVYTVDGGMKAT